MQEIDRNLLAYINRHLRTAGWHAAQMRTSVEIETKEAADDFVTTADKELDVIISSALSQRLSGCAEFTEDSNLADGLITEERIDHLAPSVARAVASRSRVWYLDPIDGTDNYVKQDGQFCVMLGLVVKNEPVYGWIYTPARDELYFGGPPSDVAQNFEYVGTWSSKSGASPRAIPQMGTHDKLTEGKSLRVMMGSRDRRDHPEIVTKLNPTEWVSMGSLGLKVMAIISGLADVYVHCSQKLKFWDTAAPVALAKAAGLTVCDLGGAPINFTAGVDESAVDIFKQKGTVLIGTPAGVREARKRIRQ